MALEMLCVTNIFKNEKEPINTFISLLHNLAYSFDDALTFSELLATRGIIEMPLTEADLDNVKIDGKLKCKTYSESANLGNKCLACSNCKFNKRNRIQADKSALIYLLSFPLSKNKQVLCASDEVTDYIFSRFESVENLYADSNIGEDYECFNAAIYRTLCVICQRKLVKGNVTLSSEVTSDVFLEGLKLTYPKYYDIVPIRNQFVARVRWMCNEAVDFASSFRELKKSGAKADLTRTILGYYKPADVRPTMSKKDEDSFEDFNMDDEGEPVFDAAPDTSKKPVEADIEDIDEEFDGEEYYDETVGDVVVPDYSVDHLVSEESTAIPVTSSAPAAVMEESRKETEAAAVETVPEPKPVTANVPTENKQKAKPNKEVKKTSTPVVKEAAGSVEQPKAEENSNPEESAPVPAPKKVCEVPLENVITDGWLKLYSCKNLDDVENGDMLLMYMFMRSRCPIVDVAKNDSNKDFLFFITFPDIEERYYISMDSGLTRPLLSFLANEKQYHKFTSCLTSLSWLCGYLGSTPKNVCEIDTELYRKVVTHEDTPYTFLSYTEAWKSFRYDMMAPSEFYFKRAIGRSLYISDISTVYEPYLKGYDNGAFEFKTGFLADIKTAVPHLMMKLFVGNNIDKEIWSRFVHDLLNEFEGRGVLFTHGIRVMNIGVKMHHLLFLLPAQDYRFFYSAVIPAAIRVLHKLGEPTPQVRIEAQKVKQSKKQ